MVSTRSFSVFQVTILALKLINKSVKEKNILITVVISYIARESSKKIVSKSYKSSLCLHPNWARRLLFCMRFFFLLELGTLQVFYIE